MIKNIIIIEEDQILKKLLSFHIAEFFNNNCNITIFDKKQFDQIFHEKRLDILLINCSLILMEQI